MSRSDCGRCHGRRLVPCPSCEVKVEVIPSEPDPANLSSMACIACGKLIEMGVAIKITPKGVQHFPGSPHCHVTTLDLH